MSTKFVYPLALVALMAFGFTTVSAPAFAQEEPAQQEQSAPQGGGAGGGD
ncbi:MAG: hypothetical protein RIB59_07395 [Rhodospirillales bacterium]